MRTPLSGIMGSAEMLMDMTEKDDHRQKLLKGIYQDADWLKALVENILSLTRLLDGKILVHKEMEALEEVIACAVAHIEKKLSRQGNTGCDTGRLSDCSHGCKADCTGNHQSVG